MQTKEVWARHWSTTLHGRSAQHALARFRLAKERGIDPSRELCQTATQGHHYAPLSAKDILDIWNEGLAVRFSPLGPLSAISYLFQLPLIYEIRCVDYNRDIHHYLEDVKHF